jgi:hypothetical protein
MFKFERMIDKFFTALVITSLMMNCGENKKNPALLSGEFRHDNLLTDFAAGNSAGLDWFNRPETFTMDDGILAITVNKGSDYFNNPEDKTITASAPFLYRNLAGDFIAQALVRPDFSSVWNAASLMVYIDSANWIKLAFENSDATGKSIVTVVTRNDSDDANGVILNEQEEVWLKIIRKRDTYSMLWSLNGDEYFMARLCAMPPAESVKIGIEAQCPVGASAIHQVLCFSVERKTVEDLRKGI